MNNQYRMKVTSFNNPESGTLYNISFTPATRSCSSENTDELDKMKWLEYFQSTNQIDKAESLIDSMYESKVKSDEQRAQNCASSSVSRSLRRIREVGLANSWDFFVTATLDPKKWDRTNYHLAYEGMTCYFRKLRDKGLSVSYVLIPELHKDGKSYHFHGLISGDIHYLMKPHSTNDLRQRGYYELQDFTDLFGFNAFGLVRNVSAVSYYCLKYISKDLLLNRSSKFAHLYFCSRGLNRPQEVRNEIVDFVPTDLLNQYHGSVFSANSVPSDFLGAIIDYACNGSAVNEYIEPDEASFADFQLVLERVR